MTTTTENQRAMVARRIRALLAKTVENGCTEGEAMAAAELARTLMDKYQIDLTEAELQAEGTARGHTRRQARGHMHIKDWLAAAVADFCDCKVWQERHNDAKALAFFGLEGDVAFATWLIDSLDAYIARATVRYMAGQQKHVLGGRRRWEVQKAFMLGAVDRINKRLREAAAERRRANQRMGDGRSLIAVKSAIVERAFAALGMRLRNRKSSTEITAGDAYGAGQAAGNHATLGRPVNGGAAVRQIAG